MEYLALISLIVYINVQEGDFKGGIVELNMIIESHKLSIYTKEKDINLVTNNLYKGIRHLNSHI